MVKALSQSLKFLKVEWTSAFVFKQGERVFSFDPTARPTLTKLWHNLRAFLRDVVLANEAKRRPRDFDGLEKGWDSREEVRANTYSMWHRKSGPALLCAGVWTRAKIDRVNRSWTDTPACVRCNRKVETLAHRLIDCAENKGFIDHHLKPLDITLDMIRALPTCTRRCGIFVEGNVWEVPKIKAVQDYFVAVNSHATQAYDKYRKGHQQELEPDFSGKTPANDPSIIYRVALPPLRNAKPEWTKRTMAPEEVG